MATITLRGVPTTTSGELPAKGSPAPDFALTTTDFGVARLADYAGGMVVLNIFPSIDTPVCAMSVRRFNQIASVEKNAAVLCVSADLPFAHQRFCQAEGLDKVVPLSVFRSPEFGRDYGVTITDGPLAGLLARAVVVIDADGKVAYTELVPEIGRDPDFDSAVKVL